MKTMLMKTAAALSLAVTLSAPAFADDTKFDTGMIPTPLILMPDSAPQAVIFLLSDASGWQDKDQKEAERLNGNGAIVIGIDTPKYLVSLAKDTDDCIYMVSDIESLSHQVQRKAGNASVLQPIVAGSGLGGTMALAILAQTPQATIGQTLAVDPEAGIPLQKELCTPAEKTVQGNHTIYGLTDGDLPDPATVVLTPAAPPDGRDHVTALVSKHSDIDVRDGKDDAASTLAATLDELVAAESQTESPLGLPLSILDATPAKDTMAIIYSGDGGWRDIDRELAGFLQKDGIPVVGVDSLRYFWSARTATETSADLERIIHAYKKRWNVHHVLLIGYSFGADILPASYNGLTDKAKGSIVQMSLLGLSHEIDWEISVSGWLGTGSGSGAGDPVDDIRKIDPKIVQCLYGADDDEDACPALKGSAVEIAQLEGGHHFDGDYEALAKLVVDGLTRRLGN
ncbi:type IV secretory pathway protein AcvB [Rhizobium sp. ACO-34A]|nr:AcvB/VirJ family lysyl-phosphatidylglycerol hydrolase [Rhizobium sp. ACO-34A]ATN36167.1 type IV secretory pathway protein AcvB [Rhizobium sp. ACO-34A]